MWRREHCGSAFIFSPVPDSAQWNQSVNYYTVAFEKNNVIYDFFMMILTTAQWLFTESKTRFTLICAAALLVCIIFAVLCIVKRKNQEFNYFMISCVAGWIIYYIIVRSGLYAYGDFGNRYSLYLLPVWFVAVGLSDIRISSVHINTPF